MPSLRDFSSIPFSPISMNFFLFNASAPPEISPLSLHDALPILELSAVAALTQCLVERASRLIDAGEALPQIDRKSTRLNSSHVAISYAVFCLKKKKMI